MNHRHQRFDWDSERGEIKRSLWGHNELRLLALGVALAGLLAAIWLACN